MISIFICDKILVFDFGTLDFKEVLRAFIVNDLVSTTKNHQEWSCHML
jgi:hypothetical protein